MSGKPNLCYAMQRKREKIMGQKKWLTKYLKYLYISYSALGLVLVSLVLNSNHFRMSPTLSGNLFPYLHKSDFNLLYLGAVLGTFLFVMSGKYNRLKTKYELLRHDIIKDLDSTIIATKICLCTSDCDCREQFVREMDALDIDIIFKKYKPESKYLV
ncbi:MAG: hypothetical protein GX115_02455 [Ruminiclostridium sp.]|nr:hypothetical protein [Ruminiclostridium sp.]